MSLISNGLIAQESNAETYVISGTIVNESNGEPLIGASVTIEGTTEGVITDYNGDFLIKTKKQAPYKLVFSYLGYNSLKLDYTSPETGLLVKLQEESLTISNIEVVGQRISDKQRQNPLTVESLDILAIKETPAANFYEGLGSLKDVDLTTASLGFTVINTRGFNSTSPVRSLQIIDGVDNQSPGLNFSLGNFLGASELDVKLVDLIVGASSAYYGPNAFNGVISMETKNPFVLKGLSLQVKGAERSLLEVGLRYADAFKNKDGNDWFAYKLNLFHLRANDWEAENYTPVYESETGFDNPGGFDAVNIYGDEFNRTVNIMGTYHRRGYEEKDLVNYATRNYKAGIATHFRLQPSKGFESPELMLTSNYGGGSTVYQGDNRFSLKNIMFFQHKIELQKYNKYFLRSYVTHEDAGDSYDPFFTALQLQRRSKDNVKWNTDYINYWQINISPKIKDTEGYPSILDFPGMPQAYQEAINDFVSTTLVDSMFRWHADAQDYANTGREVTNTSDFLEPGSAEFQAAFDDITSRISNSEGGTRFFDRSALWHTHGEYRFDDVYQGERINDIDFRVGANVRMYYPNSRGSILLDTNGVNINTYEYGVYTGTTFSFLDSKLKVSGTARLDKHQNFDFLVSPAGSITYEPSKNNFLRVSVSSAIRNPTLSDQYLNYNVGPAILRGNIDGVSGLYNVESFVDFLNTGLRDTLVQIEIPAIKPENVNTFEFGYRTTLWEKLYLDMGYYFSRYKNFIGFEFAVDADIPEGVSTPSNVQVYRVSSNARDIVTTQGLSVGFNYYFAKFYQFRGNYSFNQLNTQTDDPIIPAFNTPTNKFNLGFSGRNLTINPGIEIKNIGFSINYKWIEGFLFEGSPQFTGLVPTYDLLDAQINWKSPFDVTFKLGASNILNNKTFQTYGGPRIGRMAYLSLLYEWEK